METRVAQAKARIALAALFGPLFILTAGCSGVPPQYRDARHHVKLKARNCKIHRVREGPWIFKATLLTFYYEQLDKKTWSDITFEKLDKDLLRTMFIQMQSIAKEEERQGNRWPGRNLEAVVRVFCSKSQKRLARIERQIDRLLVEFDRKRSRFESGYYNAIAFWPGDRADRCLFAITPYDVGEARRKGIHVRVRADIAVLFGEETCVFIFGYDGQLLETIPQLRRITR